MDAIVPLIVRAATRLTLEAGDIKVTWPKGAPIDLHVDESETPFVVFHEDDPDMSGSSRSIVSTVPSAGHVQTVDDPNPEVRLVVASPAELEQAVDALTGAGISVRNKQDDLYSLYVDRNVSANAVTVLSAAGVRSRLGESAPKTIQVKPLKSTILAFTSAELTEALLANVVLEEELAREPSYENLTPIDLLVREGLSSDLVTSYIADNHGRVLNENVTMRTIRVPVRRVRRRMSTRARATELLRMKENVEAGERKVAEVSHLTADKNLHMDSVGYYVVEGLMRAPRDDQDALGRVRDVLGGEFGDRLHIVSANEGSLRVSILKDMQEGDLVEAMRQANTLLGTKFGMVRAKPNLFEITVRQAKSITESKVYGKGTPKFLAEDMQAGSDWPNITSSVGGDPENERRKAKDPDDVSVGSDVTVGRKHGMVVGKNPDQDNFDVHVGDGQIVQVPPGQVNPNVVARTPLPA